jgi:glutamate decarboxylase
MPTFALNFSRPGGQIVAQYYNFVRLGREGYTKVHSACYQTAQFLAQEIATLGPFEMLFDGDPADGIPAVCWALRPGANPGYTLYDVADRLCLRGWQVPAYSLPANCQGQVVQRIIVRLGVSRDLAGLLLENFKGAIDYLTRHPLAAKPDITAFHH